MNSVGSINKQLILSLAIKTENALIELRKTTLTTNYKNASERKLIFDMVTAIKLSYQQIESLLSTELIVKIKPPTMRMYITRIIHPQQMEGFVEKIQRNLPDIISNLDVVILREQYILLDSIVKILNGDSYFVGCTHPPS